MARNRTHRADDVQNDIVRGLRTLGASVLVLSQVGKGAPDLLVGFRGNDTLLECKSEGGNLSETQVGWHRDWRGKKPKVVRSLEDAIGAIHPKE